MSDQWSLKTHWYWYWLVRYDDMVETLTDAFLVVVYNVFTNVIIRKDDTVMITGRPVTSDADQYSTHQHY